MSALAGFLCVTIKIRDLNGVWIVEKSEILKMARKYVCPGKIDTFGQIGIDLVIGKREGPYIFDTDGKKLIDLHINGGVFNLGHRHPELIAILVSALEKTDIGNHHFASEARALLAQKLAEKTPGDLHYTVFAASGSEAVDIAIKTARWATKRRQIVSLDKGYHGCTGISGNVGDHKNIDYFLSRGSKEEYAHVPFNDLPAMENILSRKEAAAVIVETIPATYGFPLPEDGYLKGVKELCRKYRSLFIADEVQTGLGRTGNLWGVTTFGVIPDILVTGKGLSGGVYPISATVISEKYGGWLTENGFGHVSTFGGAEPGCQVASRVLDICSDPALLASVRRHAAILGEGFADLKGRYPFLKEIRQCGLVIGLKYDDPLGAVSMCKALYENGIWAMIAGFDFSVMQCKPWLFLDRPLIDDILVRFEEALKACTP
jgi:acetylornithine/succinyldiaminopimelate/putrescine aminotransferase